MEEEWREEGGGRDDESLDGNWKIDLFSSFGILVRAA